MFLSLFTMIWYVDLFKNHDKLSRDEEEHVASKFYAFVQPVSLKRAVAAARPSNFYALCLTHSALSRDHAFSFVFFRVLQFYFGWPVAGKA